MTRDSFILKHHRTFTLNVHAFSLFIRIFWIALVTALVVTELMPIPLLPPVPFYTIKVLKLGSFIAIGLLAPLAFWRFNALNRGLLFATVSAAFVETMQGIVQRGHAFHWYELVVKLILILFGFSVGLDIRYERRIKLGTIEIVLENVK
jgi:hypothetical protein